MMASVEDQGKTALCLAMAGLIALTGACGGGMRAEGLGQSAAAIAGGVPSNHAGVVAVANAYELCSGYLITEDLVLTARHCVGALSGLRCDTVAGAPYDLATFAVYTQAVVPASGSPYEAVAEVWVLPNSTGQLLCGDDLAILRLAQPIQGASVIEPRLDLPPLVGESFTAVGYGRPGGTDPTTAGTQRELAAIKVTSVGQQLYPNGTVRLTTGEWTAERGPCFGDSGSPALDVAGRSFGVMARGAGALCTDMIYEGVDPHAAWIRERVRAAAAARGVPEPSWVAPPPAGSAGFGDDCRSVDHCVSPFACLPVADRYRCTTRDCSACPAGWMCGYITAVLGCVPDPNWIPPAASEGSGDGSASRSQGCAGCGAAGGRDSGVAPWGWVLLLSILFFPSRKRRY